MSLKSRKYYLANRKKLLTKANKRYKKVKNPKCKRKDYTGLKFGNLTFMKFSRIESKHTYWIVKCDCEKEIEKRASSVTHGVINRSCGCKRGISNVKDGNIVNIKRIYRNYEHGAKNRNIKWNLNLEEFQSFIDKNCHYCNCPPNSILKALNKYHGEFIYNGIDRIINELGYNMKNCVTCCKFCNYAKNNLTTDQFLNKIKEIAIHQKLLGLK